MNQGADSQDVRRQIAWESQTLYERVILVDDAASFSRAHESREEFLSDWQDATNHDREVFNSALQAQTGVATARDTNI
jgi:hypothetical protein